MVGAVGDFLSSSSFLNTPQSHAWFKMLHPCHTKGAVMTAMKGSKQGSI